MDKNRPAVMVISIYKHSFQSCLEILMEQEITMIWGIYFFIVFLLFVQLLVMYPKVEKRWLKWTLFLAKYKLIASDGDPQIRIKVCSPMGEKSKICCVFFRIINYTIKKITSKRFFAFEVTHVQCSLTRKANRLMRTHPKCMSMQFLK